MKKKLKMLVLGSLTLVLTACGAPKGYLSYDQIEDVVSSFNDNGYITYSYEGTFNCKGLTGDDYAAHGENRSFDPSDTSYYLALPLKLDSENLEDQYASIISKFTTTDSIDTVYCYSTSENGLSFKTFSINKRLIIRRFGMEITAKWNLDLTYDANGYLISERFESVNAQTDSYLNSVYGYCTYSYN